MTKHGNQTYYEQADVIAWIEAEERRKAAAAVVVAEQRPLLVKWMALEETPEEEPLKAA